MLRAAPGRRTRSALCALLLGLAAWAAYGNATGGVFLFDDDPAIVHNHRIRSLWPPWGPLRTPADTPVAGRPVVNVSLAINYALGGLAPRGYHAVNLALHLGCGLLLFGLVRRTLEGADPTARFRGDATGLALASAAIWLTHPLTSECVDYTTQRTESIMALFFLATLTGVGRAASARSARARRGFGVLAVLACAMGMASKETMAVAPLVALLFDAAFHAGSLRGALRRRGWLHGSLAATWLLLLALHLDGSRAESVGFAHGVSPLAYAANQVVMLGAYLQRVFWPHPLILDYGWPRPISWTDVLPQAGLVVGGGVLVLFAARRHRQLAFPVLAGLLVLAPTTTLVPIVTEVGAERRMYLPLAGLVVLAVLAAWALLQRVAERSWALRLGVALSLVTVATLSGVTRARNLDYRDAETIWRRTAAAVPDNPRAWLNLGAALFAKGDLDGAEAFYEKALRLYPRYARAEAELGRLALARGNPTAAEAHLRRSLELDPRHGEVRTNLGELLERSGRVEEAMAQWRQALARNPQLAYAANNLAWTLATHADPGLRDGGEALRLALHSAELTGHTDAGVLDTLAAAQAETGRYDEALATARQARERAAAAGDVALADAIDRRAALYAAGRPFRQRASPR